MASSSSKPPRKYDVFLSFKGETRNNFLSHLYTALENKRIITYMDEFRLEIGQSLAPELLRSIEDSKLAIIVFSKDYASSTWCLNELVKIMECKATLRQTVIPIFYDVDPSDVRKQKNSFAKSFADHEKKDEVSMEQMQIWKVALRQAADIKGEDIRGRNEASCVNKIVEEVFRKLHPEASTKYLVGIESRMTKLSPLLFRKPNDVCFVGIWGMRGIGKTTIARTIFDEHIHEFEGACFLQDVSKHENIVDLQKILLSKVLNSESGNSILDIDEGSNMIRDGLCLKKVLLVLDDVNDKKQLKSLAAKHEWFGGDSVIIITTRDKHLLDEVNETYEVEFLSDSEAMQLFCWHAFKKSHPPENFVQLSRRVLSYARRVPLALEVLGSSLHRRGTDVWRSALDRRQAIKKPGSYERLWLSDDIDDVLWLPDDITEVLIDGKSFELSKASRKICYMLCARELRIEWGDNPDYWHWTSISESRFDEVAELRVVYWLEIRGSIRAQLLSLKTTYAAYLVFRFKEHSWGFNRPCKAFIRFTNDIFVQAKEFDALATIVYLKEPSVESRTRWVRGRQTLEQILDGLHAQQRMDGWMEIKLGEFYNNQEGDLSTVEIIFWETNDMHKKTGLIVEGIELRPMEKHNM